MTRKGLHKCNITAFVRDHVTMPGRTRNFVTNVTFHCHKHDDVTHVLPTIQSFVMEKEKDAYGIISLYLLRRIVILTCLSQQLVVSTVEIILGIYIYDRCTLSLTGVEDLRDSALPSPRAIDTPGKRCRDKKGIKTRIHANRLFPELPSAHCALAEKSKKVRAISRCTMPRPPPPAPYLVQLLFNRYKQVISTSSDRPVECYFRMEFSNYPPSPRASCDAAADSLCSEKYHLKKIPLEVAKGTISPNLATVRLYHSNKHSVAREVTSKNCYKGKEFLNAPKLATSRSCRYFSASVFVSAGCTGYVCEYKRKISIHFIFNIVILSQKMRERKGSFRKAKGTQKSCLSTIYIGIYEFFYRVNFHVQENTLEQFNIPQVRNRAGEDYHIAITLYKDDQFNNADKRQEILEFLEPIHFVALVIKYKKNEREKTLDTLSKSTSQGELFPTLVSSVSNHHNPAPLPAIPFSSYLVGSRHPRIFFGFFVSYEYNEVGYSLVERSLITLHRSFSTSRMALLKLAPLLKEMMRRQGFVNPFNDMPGIRMLLEECQSRVSRIRKTIVLPVMPGAHTTARATKYMVIPDAGKIVVGKRLIKCWFSLPYARTKEPALYLIPLRFSHINEGSVLDMILTFYNNSDYSISFSIMMALRQPLILSRDETDLNSLSALDLPQLFWHTDEL
ncbi:Uncharacterized protein DBV15_01873 [Temnothorax longispinosus]|uniref:Uncharacterized protein n=1 Tax=Temnothorax longispinosus TaxID=300112 RepID=A0A4S2L0H4_9HYME|nr:Uncharacterized protein DBV15_01873 [Temnothorax longispinosus]